MNNMFDISSTAAVASSISNMNSIRNSSTLNSFHHIHNSNNDNNLGENDTYSNDNEEKPVYNEKYRVWTYDEKKLYENAKRSRALLKVLSEFEEYIKDDFELMLDDYVKNKFVQFMKERYETEFEFYKEFKYNDNQLKRIKRI